MPLRKLKHWLCGSPKEHWEAIRQAKLDVTSYYITEKECTDCGSEYSILRPGGTHIGVECACRKGRYIVRSDGEIVIAWTAKETGRVDEMEESARRMQYYKPANSEEVPDGYRHE